MAGISKFSITKRKEFKLSEEAALAVILDLCEEFDIDVDAVEDKKQKRNQENLLNALLDYVRRGIIELADDGKIIHHLQNPPEGNANPVIDYKRVTGKQKLSMDGNDENDRYSMIYACLGAASGLGEHAIEKLHGIDLKVAEALSIFFL